MDAPLLDLISDLKRVAATNGGEYAGPCPFCGGRDRFRVWPDQGNTGRYWCRGCGKSGDAINILRERDGLTFRDACNHLGVMPSMSRLSRLQQKLAHGKKAAWEPKHAKSPKDNWQGRAGLFLESCQRNIALPAGAECRKWLEGRGLTEATIKAAGLGWNPADRYENRETWGLEPEINGVGQPKKLWLPAGLVIPCIQGGQISRLRVRRSNPGEGSRYIIIFGSASAPMTWNLDNHDLIVVESELDGVLLNQVAGDLVGIIAMGSAQARPDQTTHEALKKAKQILNCLDYDGSGAKEAWGWWKETYKNANRWPCPVGKDPSEAFQQGLNLRAWIKAGLPGDRSINKNKGQNIALPEAPTPHNQKQIRQGEQNLSPFDKPYFDYEGDLVIPFGADPKYHWWAGGQSLEETVNELKEDIPDVNNAYNTIQK